MAGMTRVIEHRVVQYRRTFRSSVFTSFLSPLLFLTAMGIGLGGYVDRSGGTALGGLTYLQFLAPGLLAATVMQSAAFEATFPIIGGLNWQRTFHAMYATPLSPRDIALGNLVWMAIRVAMIAHGLHDRHHRVRRGAFAARRSRDPGGRPDRDGVRRTDRRVLGDAADAEPVQRHLPVRDHAALPVLRHVLPDRISCRASSSRVAWLSPLWHGVDLTRGLVLGTLGQNPPVMLAHLVILVAIVAISSWATVQTIERRLVRG